MIPPHRFLVHCLFLHFLTSQNRTQHNHSFCICMQRLFLPILHPTRCFFHASIATHRPDGQLPSPQPHLGHTLITASLTAQHLLSDLPDKKGIPLRQLESPSRIQHISSNNSLMSSTVFLSHNETELVHSPCIARQERSAFQMAVSMLNSKHR